MRKEVYGNHSVLWGGFPTGRNEDRQVGNLPHGDSEIGPSCLSHVRETGEPSRVSGRRRERFRILCFGLGLLVGLGGFPSGVSAQQTAAEYFKKNCAICHTIGGGRLGGPDLKNVTTRRDRDWIKRLILNPQALKDSGDGEMQRLFEDYRSVMPTIIDVAGWIDPLLKLIEDESKLAKSQFAGVGMDIPEGPFAEDQIEQGRELFLGRRRFANGGPACVSCHAVEGVSALGGGRLGPDLTQVFNRLHGRKGLAAWLVAPATVTMQPIYKNHPLSADKANNEILNLVAFLEKTKDGREETGVARLNFFLLGLGGTAGSLVLFDFLWRRRFRAVRQVLVHGEAKRLSENS